MDEDMVKLGNELLGRLVDHLGNSHLAVVPPGTLQPHMRLNIKTTDPDITYLADGVSVEARVVVTVKSDTHKSN